MTQPKTYTVYYDVVTTYKVRFTENEMRSYGIEFHDAAHLTKLLQRSKTENPGTNTTLYEAFEDMVHDALSDRKDVVTEDISYDSISVVERDY